MKVTHFLTALFLAGSPFFAIQAMETAESSAAESPAVAPTPMTVACQRLFALEQARQRKVETMQSTLEETREICNLLAGRGEYSSSRREATPEEKDLMISVCLRTGLLHKKNYRRIVTLFGPISPEGPWRTHQLNCIAISLIAALQATGQHNCPDALARALVGNEIPAEERLDLRLARALIERVNALHGKRVIWDLLQGLLRALPVPTEAKLLEASPPGADGSMTMHMVDNAGTESIIFVEPYGRMDSSEARDAVRMRQAVRALVGATIPLSVMFDPNAPVAVGDIPRRAGTTRVVTGRVQEVINNFDQSRLIGIHNFANAGLLGGGAWNGRRAQEESLMRRLPEILLSYMLREGRRRQDVFLRPTEILVTQGTDANRHLCIFASAAPWLHRTAADGSVILHANDHVVFGGRHALSREEYEEILTNSIRNFFKAARARGVRVCITGAWGSGVYNNDPRVVAAIFHRVLNADDGTNRDYLWKENFDEVIFVIPGAVRPGVEDRNNHVYRSVFP